MASTVTRSQSNRAPFGCGGNWDVHHGCAADTIDSSFRTTENSDQNYASADWPADHLSCSIIIKSMLCALSAQTHLTGLPGNRHPLTPTSLSSSFLLRVLMYAGSGPGYHRSTQLDERTRRVISGTTTLIHSPIDWPQLRHSISEKSG